jgi:hypothetical protein
LELQELMQLVQGSPVCTWMTDQLRKKEFGNSNM